MATQHEKRSGATAERSAPAEEKHYPVVHAILLGKGETRERRSSGHVTAAEVGGEATIQQLLQIGAIHDPDAPVRPSEASDEKARTVVIDIATRGGVITREGERFNLGGRAIGNAEALSALPLAEIADAIVERLRAA